MKLLVAMALLAEAGSLVAAEPTQPTLVLFLAIDQGRAEYLERFRPVLEGGLLRLVQEGASFLDTHQDHGVTVTAAGHAALSTGLFPSHSGIVANDWYDRVQKREVYCVEDREAPVLRTKEQGAAAARPAALGRSPRNLLGESLGDWIKRKSKRSKVYAVAGKDRSSVLMGGKTADAAFWYDGETGDWVTSRYYMRRYPGWVRKFHERGLADGYFGIMWEALPVADALLSSMAIEGSGEGAEDSGIPKTIGTGSLSEDTGFYQALFETPFIEPYLFAFAEALVREERLGEDEWTDLLALSFSSVDSVGHDYGPNSRELLDAVMRLDRELGAFFRFLDERLGRSRFAVVLSADHGVAPLPEYRRKHGLPGGRISTEAMECLRSSGDDAEKLSLCPSVARVWTRSQIEEARARDDVDPRLLLFSRSYHPERGPELFVQLEEFYIDEHHGTTHGSPYEYDTHVPGVILWPGLAPRVVRQKISTVDLPVTLAALLGVEPPEAVDGVDRSALMR